MVVIGVLAGIAIGNPHFPGESNYFNDRTCVNGPLGNCQVLTLGASQVLVLVSEKSMSDVQCMREHNTNTAKPFSSIKNNHSFSKGYFFGNNDSYEMITFLLLITSTNT